LFQTSPVYLNNREEVHLFAKTSLKQIRSFAKDFKPKFKGKTKKKRKRK
jgi:hypothetical protein